MAFRGNETTHATYDALKIVAGGDFEDGVAA